MSSPLLDTKPALTMTDTINQQASGLNDADRNGNVSHALRENGIDDANVDDLKISLLPSIFEVVKTMEKKEAATASASDVTNQLNQFHSKLKKTREAVERYLPAGTIGECISNKAVYITASVAYGWVGDLMRFK